MTSLLNRSSSALLVIDVQNSVVDSAFNRDTIVANIALAVERARSSKTPVIWVQHSAEDLPLGSKNWEIVPELVPREGEPIIHKRFRSSFEETNLEEVLASLEVGRIFISGAETNNCVRHTTHAALERGYDITVLSDSHTTNDLDWNGYHFDAKQIIDDYNINFYEYELPGRSAHIETAVEANF